MAGKAALAIAPIPGRIDTKASSFVLLQCFSGGRPEQRAHNDKEPDHANAKDPEDP
jgi:hypothetical protein